MSYHANREKNSDENNTVCWHSTDSKHVRVYYIGLVELYCETNSALLCYVW